MTALDRHFVRLRFVALAIPFGLLLWLPSASVPITGVLAGLLGACNGVAALAIQKKAVPRFARPMAVLLLVLDHLVVSGWILLDRKSTRLNSSHVSISYAVFCLKKKSIQSTPYRQHHMRC